MRRKDKEITNIKEIESIIQSGKVCRIAFSYNDGPYIVPMNYGYNENTLYFHSAKKGKKIDLINKNNQVCFEIDINYKINDAEIPCDWGSSYSSVIGYGKAIILDNLKEKEEALKIILNHYSPGKTYEFSEKRLLDVAIIKIEISELTGKKSR
jgi:nitroimidazol reductase NimA-like FMN-containing flavoprotein (pyridoxamine 5'-phosphate oxidase superfamily)